jgi:hypothetical protein
MTDQKHETPAPGEGEGFDRAQYPSAQTHDTGTGRQNTAGLLDAAVSYAETGWPIFPLNGKEPIRGSHGFKDATADVETVRRWWTKMPNANIGTAIPDTLAVVDVDAKAGGLDTLRELENSDGVPETLTAHTGGGGLHLYFLHPAGELRQGASILGTGIDTRIPGKGYTVLPPSVHPSGREYEWHDENAPPAPMPRWMVDRLRPSPPPGHAARRAARVWGTGDLDARLRGVLSTVSPDGPEWNSRLHWAACRAGEMVREGADPARLFQLLLDAAGPWNERESRKAHATIRSGFSKVGAL